MFLIDYMYANIDNQFLFITYIHLYLMNFVVIKSKSREVNLNFVLDSVIDFSQ